MRVRTFAPLAALLLLPLFAACNGDDDADEETATAAPTGATSVAGTATPGSGGTPEVETPSGTPGEFSGSTDPVEVVAPPSVGPVLLRTMRAAAQEGFDRIVFEFEGNTLPGYKVEYVDSVSNCGSGQDVTAFLGGGTAPEAILLVDIRPSDAHNQQGQPTAPRDLSPNLATIERAFGICDFEAVVTYALALSGEKEFKVSTLQDPARLVIDVAQ
jgi:hypothetical protein